MLLHESRVQSFWQNKQGLWKALTGLAEPLPLEGEYCVLSSPARATGVVKLLPPFLVDFRILESVDLPLTLPSVGVLLFCMFANSGSLAICPCL